MDKLISFERYGKHVPRILQRQILSSLLEYKDGVEGYEYDMERVSEDNMPSIRRFYAVLLFVDISGFTILSQKLDVDSLRRFINAYFTKLLDVVHKHGGDTIKFAGDALFIVWSVSVSPLEDLNNNEDIRYAVKRATDCSLEINATCSNYKVEVSNRSAMQGMKLMEIVTGGANDSMSSPSKVDTSYLNVHSGLAMGVMCGLDVGINDRWEYLLIGNPLNEVAIAESEAHVGELAVSPEVHHVLHPHGTCNCKQTEKGYFIVTDASSDREISHDTLASSNTVVMPSEQSAKTSEDSFEDELWRGMSEVTMHDVYTSDVATVCDDFAAKMEFKTGVRKMLTFESLAMKLEDYIVEIFAKHTHHVARGEFRVQNISGESIFAYDSDHTNTHGSSGDETIGEQQQRLKDGISNFELGEQRASMIARRKSRTRSVDTLSRKRSSLRERYQLMREKASEDDSFLLAELREVIVLFINLSLTNCTVDSIKTTVPRANTSNVDQKLQFLPRNSIERDIDRALLNKFQDCFAVIASVLQFNRGQVRQFIVDDKGTVAIGTFGLRGSMTDDNAAAAVDAAQELIAGLEEIGINASIGVTSGKVYCGLVGSNQRHEYAVMGPSVNLSARLMGKAPPGGIVCDITIRSRDRKHSFLSLGEVVAKGYANPVPIFRPLPASELEIHDEARSISMKGGTAVRRLSRFNSMTRRSMDVSMKSIGRGPSRRASMEGIATGRSGHTTYEERIFGRTREMQQAVSLLSRLSVVPEEVLFEYCFNPKQSSPTTRTMSGQEEPIFKLTEKSMFILVSGASGMGKTFFVDHFCRNILQPTKFNEHWNVIVHIAEQSTKRNISEPFRSWKSVMISIAAHFDDVSRVPILYTAGGQKNNVSRKMLTRAARGIHELVALLPPELQEMAPLLSTLTTTFVFPDTEAAKKIQGASRLVKVADLLLALVAAYCKHVGRLVIINIDQLNLLDTNSMNLLKKLWHEVNGIVFLSTLPVMKQDRLSISAPGGILSDFDHSEHFLRMNLTEIDEESHSELLMSVLGNDTGVEIEESVCQEMYRETGGNPVFAFELARAFSSHLIKEATNPTLKSKPSMGNMRNVNTQLGQFLRDSQMTRIDEVIHYRFDQLSHRCQLVIKAASVACSNGADANLFLLAEMLTAKHEDQSSLLFPSTMTITEAASEVHTIMTEILSYDQFLTVQKRRKSQFEAHLPRVNIAELDFDDFIRKEEDVEYESDGDDERDDHERILHSLDIHIYSVLINFRIDMEQRIIYDMMLAEQKSLFHERVACHIESQNVGKEKFTTPAEVFEEAFHWDRAEVWPAAMTTYYRSGMLLDGLGALIESRFQLLLAYQILNRLRAEAGIEVPDESQPVKLLGLLGTLNAMNPTTQHATSAGGTNTSSRAVSRGGSMRRMNISFADKLIKDKSMAGKVELFQTFGGDRELFETAVNVVLRLAQSCLTLDNDNDVTAKLYEEALEMITVTQVKHSGSTPCTPAQHNFRFGSRSESVDQDDLEAFGLKDPAVCFPVLSGLIVLYHTKKLQDDECMSKEMRVCDLFLEVARSNPKYNMHVALGLTFLRNIYHELGRIDAGLELIDMSHQKYDSATQNEEITKVYGSDRMPRVFAVNLQILLLKGYTEKIDMYLEYLKKLSDEIKHLHTLAMMAIPLSACYIAMGKYQAAFDLYRSYMKLESEQMAFSHFKDLNPVMMTWIRLELRAFVTKYRPEMLSEPLKAPAPEILLQKITSKALLKFPMSARSFVYTALDFFGASLEYVAARILYLNTVYEPPPEPKAVEQDDVSSKVVEKDSEAAAQQQQQASPLLTAASIAASTSSSLPVVAEGKSVKFNDTNKPQLEPIMINVRNINSANSSSSSGSQSAANELKLTRLHQTLEYLDYYLECVKEDRNFVFCRIQALFLQVETLAQLLTLDSVSTSTPGGSKSMLVSLMKSSPTAAAELANDVINEEKDNLRKKIYEQLQVAIGVSELDKYPWIKQRVEKFYQQHPTLQPPPSAGAIVV